MVRKNFLPGSFEKRNFYRLRPTPPPLLIEHKTPKGFSISPSRIFSYYRRSGIRCRDGIRLSFDDIIYQKLKAKINIFLINCFGEERGVEEILEGWRSVGNRQNLTVFPEYDRYKKNFSSTFAEIEGLPTRQSFSKSPKILAQKATFFNGEFPLFLYIFRNSSYVKMNRI